MKIEELKVGVTYWVKNGHWSFVVKEVLSDRVIAEYVEIEGTFEIPFDDTLLEIEIKN